MTDSASQFKEVAAIKINPDLYKAAAHVAEKNGWTAPGELFEDHSVDLDSGQRITMHFPPPDIEEAVQKVDEYFRYQRAVTNWAYGPLQSRDFNPHPNLARAGLTGFVGNDVQLDDVRRLAFAFMCDVVPRSTPEGDIRAAKAALAVVLDAPSFRDTQWDDLSDFNKQRALEIVAAVKNALMGIGAL